MVCLQEGAGFGERGEQADGVVVAECLQEAFHGGGRLGGEVVQGADLTREAAQVGGVLARPAAHRAVGCALVAGGPDALLAGAARPGAGVGVGAQAQVTALGGLAALDAEGFGEVGPGRAGAAGGLDQAGLPAGELLAQVTQQQQCGQGLPRVVLVVVRGGGAWRAVRAAASIVPSAAAAARNDAGLTPAAPVFCGFSAVTLSLTG